MATVVISQQLSEKAYIPSRLEVSNGTIKDIVYELMCDYPQLNVFLMDNFGEESRKVILVANGKVVEQHDLPTELGDEGTLYILYDLPSGDYDAIYVPIAEALAEYMSVAAAEAIIQGVIYAAVNIGISMAISAIMGALTDSLSEPMIASGSLDNSASYTFTGIKNTTASGTPVNIVYGKHRIGGHILSLYTTIEDTKRGATVTDTVVKYLLGLCEGEVEAITDIEVNKLPSSYYNGVTIETRLGTASQSVIANFLTIDETVSTNRKVINVSPNIVAPNEDVTYQPVYGYCSGVVKALAIFNNEEMVRISTGYTQTPKYYLGLYQLEYYDEEE